MPEYARPADRPWVRRTAKPSALVAGPFFRAYARYGAPAVGQSVGASRARIRWLYSGMIGLSPPPTGLGE